MLYLHSHRAALLSFALSVLTPLVAVAQPQRQPSPGWHLQSALRILEANASARAKDSDLTRMVDAYKEGRPSFQSTSGQQVRYAAEITLPETNWAEAEAEPALQHAGSNPDPEIETFETVGSRTGNPSTTAVLGPLQVADDLCLTIELTVVSAAGADEGERRRDLLLAKVKLHAGGPLAPKPIADMKPTVFVDLWSRARGERISLSDWTQRSGPLAVAAGLPDDPAHFTVNIYGPLLYKVLAAPPEYLLINGRKIALSEQFRIGCERLCKKVRDLREKDGQSNPPKCT